MLVCHAVGVCHANHFFWLYPHVLLLFLKSFLRTVMDATKPHWIEYVWIQDATRDTILAVQKFQPTDPSPPTVTCSDVGKATSIRAYGYCNLHGLWESDVLLI
jgi:Desulfoferrodoxin